MWLETAVEHPLKNFYKSRHGPPDTVVLHWSAGGGEPEDVAHYLAKKRASYHLVIGRDGALALLLSPDDAAWHAGDGRAWSSKPSINRRSVGVCLCNRGPVSEVWATAHPDRVWRGEHFKAGFRSWRRFELYTAELSSMPRSWPCSLTSRRGGRRWRSSRATNAPWRPAPRSCVFRTDLGTFSGLTWARFPA